METLERGLSSKDATGRAAVRLDDRLLAKIGHIHAALRIAGNEERTEFTAMLLKWSQSPLVLAQPRATPIAADMVACEKKFGHVDIHRQFALNLWAGKFLCFLLPMFFTASGKSSKNVTQNDLTVFVFW